MKTAIIGMGRMGKRHLGIVTSAGLEVVGICDAHETALASACAEYQIDPGSAYRDAAKMLKERKPDCVIVATTAPTHCRFTCLAAENDVQMILCEKPMAVSIEECDRMIAVCRTRGVRLSVNHQMRFMEQYTEPRRLLSSPSFGGLRSMTVVAGNFGLAMNGCHYFEVFRLLTGSAPATVAGWFSEDIVPNPRGGSFEDRAGCIRLVGRDGIRFYLDASSDQGHGFQVIYTGKFGQLIVDEPTGYMRWSVRDESSREQPTTRYLMPFSVGECKIQPADAIAPTRSVLDALRFNQGYPSGEDGALAVKILVGAHISNERGNRDIRLEELAGVGGRVFPWA